MSTAPPPPPHVERRAIDVALVVLLLATLLARWQTVFDEHREFDERIYQQLSYQLLNGHGYTLQGTRLLDRSHSPTTYDRPLFHYPPLLATLMVPIVAVAPSSYGVAVCWLGHLALLIALWSLIRRATLPAESEAGAIAALWLASTDPILFFTTNKIWVDGLMGGLFVSGVAAYDGLLRSGRRSWMIGAALACGAALLTKGPALLGVPLLALWTLVRWPRQAPVELRRRVAWGIAGFVALTLLIAGWWYLWFYQTYGQFIGTWTRPDADLLEGSAFVRAVWSRPWYTYFYEFPLINPILFVLLPGTILIWRRSRHRDLLALCWLWILGMLGLFTLLGCAGHTFQMRFLTMATGPIYLIVALLWADLPTSSRVRGSVLALALLCGLINIGLCAEITEHNLAELRSLFHHLGWL